LFIIDRDLDFISFVDCDFKVFIPSVSSGGVGASALRSFDFEGYKGLTDLLRGGTGSKTGYDWSMLEFASSFDSHIELAG
jgi:hypothetical protein